MSGMKSTLLLLCALLVCSSVSRSTGKFICMVLNTENNFVTGPRLAGPDFIRSLLIPGRIAAMLRDYKAVSKPIAI